MTERFSSGRLFAAAMLAAGVLVNPSYAEDAASRFAAARQLVRDGDPDAALASFSELREQYPWDVDYAVARAQVLTSLGRDDEALLELAEATRLAPDYEDAWRLRYLLLSRQSDADRQAERESMRQEAAARFPQATWWRLPDDAPLWTVLVGAGHDYLSNGFPGWNDQFVDITREQLERYRVGMRLARNARNGDADYSIGLRAEHTSRSGWFAGADLWLANDPTFQPDLGYSVHAGAPFADDWVASLGYRRREYASTTVGSVIGTIEKYHGDFRFAYGLTQSRLQGASSFMSHALTSNWYYSQKASMGITVSTGREVESVGFGRLIESDVRGISLSGRHQLSEQFGVQWWLGTHQQGDFYRRRFIGLAVSIRL